MNYYDPNFALSNIRRETAKKAQFEAPLAENLDGGRVAGMKKPGMLDGALDIAQTGLSIAGLVPGWGIIPDVANAGVSALRGRWGEAGLNLVAALPGIGDAIQGVNLGGKAVKVVGGVMKRGGG